MTKQYPLYDPKLKKLLMARKVFFNGHFPFYKPLEQPIFCPVSTNDSIVIVSQSTGENTDFNAGVDDVESLSSDDFDHANDEEEEEGQHDHSGQSQRINFEEVTREPERVVMKTPKCRTSDQITNTLGSYWRGSDSGQRRIRTETGGEGRSNQGTSIDLPLLVADATRMITDALDRPNGSRWIEAINSELMSLEGHKTWSVGEEEKVPKNARAISSRMVLQEKIGQDGKVARYKAHVVAQGSQQREGIDYSKNTAPPSPLPPFGLFYRERQLKIKKSSNSILLPPS